MQRHILNTHCHTCSLVWWGYFISLECYFSEATEAFDLIRLIRWGWVVTWLVMQVCVWEISPSGAYSIGCCKAEQKMHLLLLWLWASHHVYLRYCPAGRITDSCELHMIFLFHCTEETLLKHARDMTFCPKRGVDKRCHLLCQNCRLFSYHRPFIEQLFIHFRAQNNQ